MVANLIKLCFEDEFCTMECFFGGFVSLLGAVVFILGESNLVGCEFVPELNELILYLENIRFAGPRPSFS